MDSGDRAAFPLTYFRTPASARVAAPHSTLLRGDGRRRVPPEHGPASNRMPGSVVPGGGGGTTSETEKGPGSDGGTGSGGGPCLRNSWGKPGRAWRLAR
eukprot:gene9486-biopygen12766